MIGHLLFKEIWLAKGPTYIHCVTHLVITDTMRELLCDYRLFRTIIVFHFSVMSAARTGSCLSVNALQQRRIKNTSLMWLWRKPSSEQCAVVVMWIHVVTHTLWHHTRSTSVCHAIPMFPAYTLQQAFLFIMLILFVHCSFIPCGSKRSCWSCFYDCTAGNDVTN